MILTATAGLGVLEAAGVGAWGERPAWIPGATLMLGATWSIVGAVVARRRSSRRIGLMMMLFGAQIVAVVPGPHLRSSTWAAQALIAVSSLAFGLLPAPAAQIILSYPSGRLPDRLCRAFVAVAYGWGLLDGTRLAFVPAPRSTWALVAVIGWCVLALGAGVLLARRVVTATRRERRVLALPFGLIAATLTLLVLRELWLIGQDAGWWATSAPAWLELILLFAATITVPVAFLIGLLQHRLAFARVGDLIRGFEASPPAAVTDITAALARALGDPGLQVAFPVERGYVDARGQVTVLPPATASRGVTPIGPPEAPMAMLLHDLTLRDEPALLLAAGSAARLALENARLRAQVLARTEDVRASQARLVEAGDRARRRLERDLHDGAQQRLLSAGLALQRLRMRQPPLEPDCLHLLDATAGEMSGALAELRELARGIHPAVLTDLGLPAAVDQLTQRCPLPVEVRCALADRLPGPVESTAYFVINESLSNVVKHARAGRVRLSVDHRPGILMIEMSDDGIGGADPTAGSGLAGLADRVSAAGGLLRLDSPSGVGTRVQVALPC